MKKTYSFLLISLTAICFVACNTQKEKVVLSATQASTLDWKRDTLATGCVWHQFDGVYADFDSSHQFVNVLELDYTLPEYTVDLVYDDVLDSLSSFAQRNDAFVAMNGTYFDTDVSVTFIKTNGTINKEVEVAEDHLRYWKHEGAFCYNRDTKKVEFLYGNNDKFKTLTDYTDVFTCAPMLIFDEKPVGVDYVGEIEGDFKQFKSEDYRRHQGVRHPRTAIGITKDNKMLLITVDGRRKISAGMSAKELTLFVQREFAPQYLLNLDGGGSTSMWIKERGDSLTNIVTYPTDNKKYDHYGQRPMGNAIIVKKK